MSSSSPARATVSLYRYDLTQGMARSMGPMLVGRPIEGIWHTSIVVFGKEYYFDGGLGIMADPHPGRTRFGPPHRAEVLGATTKREDEFFVWTQQQRAHGFGPNDYHLLNNNCNSFTDAASLFLLQRHIPDDVREMIPMLLSTPMGQMLRPMLEQATGGMSAGVAPRSPPLAQPRPSVQTMPSPSLSSPSNSTNASSADVCVGLRSTRDTLTESDEEDLMLAQVMLESNETIADGPRSPPDAFEKAITGLTLLRTVMRNICAHPGEARYRALSTESNAYTSKLKPLETYGVVEVLRIAGFVRRPHSSGSGGEQWFLADAAGSAPVLHRVAEMLTVTIASIETAAAAAADARRHLQDSARSASAEAVAHVHTADLRENEVDESATLETPPPPPPSVSADPEQIIHHEHPPSQTESNAKTRKIDTASTPALRYCRAPFPNDWVPLPVGTEGGAPLYSNHCLPHSRADSAYCFGKCRLSPSFKHVQAYYCSSDGREVDLNDGEYEVLCVGSGREGDLCWVPVRLTNSKDTAPFYFTAYGRFGVARAEHGAGTQPGVMEPSGRCVIPYGGRATVVTDVAEVLCVKARLPAKVRETYETIQKGANLSKLLRAASGQAIASFDELLRQWQPPAFYVPPHPLVPRTRAGVTGVDWESGTTGKGEGGSRLLVCHDFSGGYTRSESRLFLLGEGEALGGASGSHAMTATGSQPSEKEPSPRFPAIEGAYTVSYWDRTDCFVYFSHQRISAPPREWVHNAHRHGVPVLGTIITEAASGRADLDLLLSDAKRMAAVIERLTQLCDTYGFDGYLINVENGLPPVLAKRLVVFCAQLRKQLNRKSISDSGISSAPRQVIWYDAVTIEGNLHYQNALTARNKPFFDVCDGIFTNYFWNPVHIALTRTMAGPRASDVYVGVDVFGRNMYGGGGYNTSVAVEEAAHAALSVALFAPGWTAECESRGTRNGFLQADSRMWSRVQGKFAYHTRLLSFNKGGSKYLGRPLSCAWTTFQSSVGYHFYVNGHRITGPHAHKLPVTSHRHAHHAQSTSSGWCELSGAHALPPFLYEAPSTSTASSTTATPASTAHLPAAPSEPLSIRLPASSLKGGMYGATVAAQWRFDKAWFGDRCLDCLVPPMEAAEVLRWYVRGALPPATDAASPVSLHLEAVFDTPIPTEEEQRLRTTRSAAMGAVSECRGLRLGLYAPSRGAFHVCIWEKDVERTENVAGTEGVQVRARYPTRGSGASPTAAASDWCPVQYELLNTTNEVIHLASVAVANGDASRTLRCRLGGLAVYQKSSSLSTAMAQTSKDTETAHTCSEEDEERGMSVLHAQGPQTWPVHHLHRTHRDAEQVLDLQAADTVFAEIRRRHGLHSTVVLFASVEPRGGGHGAIENITHVMKEEPQQPTAAAANAAPPHCISEHRMYVGQYSVNPVDGTTYQGSLLISVSLPQHATVSSVSYYVVHNGY